MADRIIAGIRVAGIVYLLAISVDHFFLHIPWRHVLIDWHTIGAMVLFGVIAAIFKRKK